MIVAGIEHPGFAFLQVLSPCPTYCPQQQNWKNVVRDFDDGPTSNLEQASRRIHMDDGFSTGIIFQTEHPVWPRPGTVETDLARLAQEFVI